MNYINKNWIHHMRLHALLMDIGYTACDDRYRQAYAAVVGLILDDREIVRRLADLIVEPREEYCHDH